MYSLKDLVPSYASTRVSSGGSRSLTGIHSLIRPLQQATQGSGLLRPQVSGMNVASLLGLHSQPVGLPFDSLPLLVGEPQPFDLVICHVSDTRKTAYAGK
jgi:hypothetical protein